MQNLSPLKREKVNWLERTELLIKEEGIQKLQNARVLIVGLGGVGGVCGRVYHSCRHRQPHYSRWRCGIAH